MVVSAQEGQHEGRLCQSTVLLQSERKPEAGEEGRKRGPAHATFTPTATSLPESLSARRTALLPGGAGVGLRDGESA